MARKLFCEISPTCYKISVEKEILLRHCKDLLHSVSLARQRQSQPLPNLVKSHTSLLARRLHGVDMNLQYNKATNIQLACDAINGLVIHPGESFSFWKMVGRPTARRGFREGLVITRKNGLIADVGGGLCQMANMVHWLV
ncbi:MAG: VanW family protein, partial [Oscillospiraceae bacterium]|nr:VanW family protein [Oscillospiraceae bacterium]